MNSTAAAPCRNNELVCAHQRIRIELLLEEHNLTRSQIAERLRISVRNVDHVANHPRRYPAGTIVLGGSQ